MVIIQTPEGQPQPEIPVGTGLPIDGIAPSSEFPAVAGEQSISMGQVAGQPPAVESAEAPQMQPVEVQPAISAVPQSKVEVPQPAPVSAEGPNPMASVQEVPVGYGQQSTAVPQTEVPVVPSVVESGQSRIDGMTPAQVAPRAVAQHHIAGELDAAGVSVMDGEAVPAAGPDEAMAVEPVAVPETVKGQEMPVAVPTSEAVVAPVAQPVLAKPLQPKPQESVEMGQESGNFTLEHLEGLTIEQLEALLPKAELDSKNASKYMMTQGLNPQELSRAADAHRQAADTEGLILRVLYEKKMEKLRVDASKSPEQAGKVG